VQIEKVIEKYKLVANGKLEINIALIADRHWRQSNE